MDFCHVNITTQEQEMKSELYKDRNKDGKRVSKIIVASVDLDPCEKVVGG